MICSNLFHLSIVIKCISKRKYISVRLGKVETFLMDPIYCFSEFLRWYHKTPIHRVLVINADINYSAWCWHGRQWSQFGASVCLMQNRKTKYGSLSTIAWFILCVLPNSGGNVTYWVRKVNRNQLTGKYHEIQYYLISASAIIWLLCFKDDHA